MAKSFLVALLLGFHLQASSQNVGIGTLETHAYEDTFSTLTEVFDLFRGKVIYIDFWASWCRPCIEEFPYSKHLQETLRDENIIFLFLGYRDAKDNWLKALKNYKLSGHHVLLNAAMQMEAISIFGILAIPHYAIIGKDGKPDLVMALPPSYEDTLSYLKDLAAED